MSHALRRRLAVGLVSLAVIGLELTLMRLLSLRFWHHLAFMVISVALLGFGASGTVLTLLRRRIRGRETLGLCVTAFGFALSVPAIYWASQALPLNVQYLAWNPRGESLHVLALELILLLPFFFAGAMVGLALMDRPERVAGNYAANLIGSGAGGVASVLLMYVMSAPHVLAVMAATGFVAGALLVSWRSAPAAGATAAAAIALVFLLGSIPGEPAMSQYKMLPQYLAMPDTKVLHRREGPLGRIDVVEGPAVHFAPGLSLQYTEPLPPHILMVQDGDQASAVYDCRRLDGWKFLDQTTPAAAYRLADRPRTLIVGAGGGADIGLALFHRARSVTALEMNPQVIELMTGPLANRGGDIYRRDAVRVRNREARGYLATTRERFDLIVIPPLDAFGVSGAGVQAAQESYLYTVESVAAMLDRLHPNGVLCITRWARTPPRDGLKVFDMVAQALRKRGNRPAESLAMIRNWATVSVLARPGGIGGAEALRAFCEERSFDLCYLPDMRSEEANRFHRLRSPYYYKGAQALLSPRRDAFLDRYLFELEAPTDNRPFFFRFFKWGALPTLREQLGGQSPAFLELGYLMVAAAFLQAVILGLVAILTPLLPTIKAIRNKRRKGTVFGYFLLLGIGFMGLEMAFLQKLVLFLAHPIYSASAVIAGFLVFAGLGSWMSSRRSLETSRVIVGAAAAVVGIAALYFLALDPLLGAAQSLPMGLRFTVALVAIAPLAFAMGHLFPMGLRRLSSSAPELVPWAWAVNGCASVATALGAPLLAMETGFGWLILLAALCYALAGLLGYRLPTQSTRKKGARAPTRKKAARAPTPAPQ